MAGGQLGHCNWDWRNNACMSDAKRGIELGPGPSCVRHGYGLSVYLAYGHEARETASVGWVFEALGMERTFLPPVYMNFTVKQ